MGDVSNRLRFAVPVVVAATVFAFACGSSSVHAANEVGKPLRWVMLFVLLGVAGAWAAARRPRELPAPGTAAVATAFLALALVSSLWSIDARLTAERAISLAILFAAAGLLALACAGRPRDAELVLAGLLGGATAVARAGLVTAAVDPRRAAQAASRTHPRRYQGFGENPNTSALLLALALPIAVWFALRPGRIRVRLGALAVALLLDGSIVASLSRGALVGAFVGSFVVVGLVSLPARRRLLAAGAVAVLAVASVGGQLVPSPSPAAAPPAVAASSPAPAPSQPSTRRYLNVDKVFPLSFDIGSEVQGLNVSQPRKFLGLSGRGVAWREAVDQAAKRPVAGYGFGAESEAFINRYALFAGSVPENAYIGIGLQLGLIGLAAFLALFAAFLVPMLRAPTATVVPACLGVFSGGLVLAVVLFYMYSVGDIGAVTFWIAAFLGAVAAARPEPAR